MTKRKADALVAAEDVELPLSRPAKEAKTERVEFNVELNARGPFFFVPRKYMTVDSASTVAELYDQVARHIGVAPRVPHALDEGVEVEVWTLVRRASNSPTAVVLATLDDPRSTSALRDVFANEPHGATISLHAHVRMSNASDLREVFADAVRCGDLKRMDACLAKDATIDLKDAPAGSSALALASVCGQLQSAHHLLLEHKVDVDYVNPTRPTERTPLHWAIVNGHTDVACLLIEHGANIDAADVSVSYHARLTAVLAALKRKRDGLTRSCVALEKKIAACR